MLTVTPDGGTTVTNTYDALGRMVENNAGGAYSEFVYGPTGVKLAKVNGTTLIKAFVALPGGAKAIYNSTGLAYYRHSDWLNSSRLTSTQARGLYSSSAYAPFGEQYATAGTADSSFTGQDQDTVSTLYDFPARRQSPSQGRWVSPDPAGRGAVNLANPQSWNRYAYVLNNPLALTDPAGLSVRHHRHHRVHSMDEENDCEDGCPGDDDDDDDDGGSPPDDPGSPPDDPGSPPDDPGSPPDNNGSSPPDNGGDNGVTIDISALGNCISDQFPGVVLLDATPTVGNGSGVPGNSNGSATLIFTGAQVGTVTNDIMSVGLQGMPQGSPIYTDPVSEPTVGYADLTNPWTNYTASGMLGQAAVDTQIWELGNSIAGIEYALPAQLANPSQDPGATTLNCYQNATGTPQD